jgi:hypothetical protein
MIYLEIQQFIQESIIYINSAVCLCVHVNMYRYKQTGGCLLIELYVKADPKEKKNPIQYILVNYQIGTFFLFH